MGALATSGVSVDNSLYFVGIDPVEFEKFSIGCVPRLVAFLRGLVEEGFGNWNTIHRCSAVFAFSFTYVHNRQSPFHRKINEGSSPFTKASQLR